MKIITESIEILKLCSRGRFLAAWQTTRSSEAARLLFVTIQLFVVVLVLLRFRIEQTFGLTRILPLILGGFVIHALLPQRYRIAFFFFLSIAAIGVVLPFPHSMIVVLIGLLLIGICHLPIAFSLRISLLLIVGSGLAAVRAGWVDTSAWGNFPTLTLPILAAMFMFRLAIYVYDLRHETSSASIWQRLSYFFLLPNCCFLLFPVVDYRTFCRTYYDAEEYSIYQKGVFWIFRGLTHLLLYRIVYQYFVPAPGDIQGLAGVVLFVVTSYLMYLRISGQFHIIIGILCLFGFNLPETHHLYFLASSFNDFWRRINIYWKDFMMKVFYYPSFVRMRKIGMKAGIALATLIVFLGTWILHSYQWFWLRGTFPIRANDGIFWGVLAILVVANSLMEAQGARKRRIQDGHFELKAALSLAIRTTGMLSFVCILWSFWSSGSVGGWLALLANARNSGPAAFGILILGFAGIVTIGVIVQYILARRQEGMPRRGFLVGGAPPALRMLASACVLLVVTIPNLPTQVGRDVEAVIGTLRQNSLNLRDRELAERSYYEGLLDAGNFTTQLWIATAGRPTGREWTHTRNSDVVRFTKNFLEYELKPSYAGTYKDAPFETSRWGMRDKDYEQTKPPNVYRVALIGASYELGAGVPNEGTFESVAEAQWNTEQRGTPYEGYEILNFSVGGYGMLQKLVVAETRVVPFDLDLALLTIYPTEHVRTLAHLTRVVSDGLPIPYAYIEQLVRQTGATAEMRQAEIEQRLRPIVYDVIDWTFRQFTTWSREQGIELLVVYLPVTEYTRDGTEDASRVQVLERALEAGLEPVSLNGLFDGYEVEEIRLAPWDNHLSLKGHEIMGKEIYNILRERAR